MWSLSRCLYRNQVQCGKARGAGFSEGKSNPKPYDCTHSSSEREGPGYAGQINWTELLVVTDSVGRVVILPRDLTNRKPRSSSGLPSSLIFPKCKPTQYPFNCISHISPNIVWFFPSSPPPPWSKALGVFFPRLRMDLHPYPSSPFPTWQPD